MSSPNSNPNSNLRKPVFTKIDQLRPGTSGHNLIVKVTSAKIVLQKGRPDSQVRQMRIAECLIGDDTGIVIFTARNDQVDLMKEGSTVILRNAKIDMFKGSMRLAVDKWGRIEVTEPAEFSVKEENNLSLVEYELVNVQGLKLIILHSEGCNASPAFLIKCSLSRQMQNMEWTVSDNTGNGWQFQLIFDLITNSLS